MIKSLKYLGSPIASDDREGVWRPRVPVPFLICVVAPTFAAAIYFLVIASPRYVAEAQFTIESPTQPQASPLGVVLQGVGLPAGQSDAFAIHEYMQSRGGLRALMENHDMREILGPPGSDFWARYPRPWEGDSFEDMYKGYRRFITVGYDSTTGLSTLRIESFRPADSVIVANALLDLGETLVNRLNERATQDAVAEAETTLDEAQAALVSSQERLTAFRNREQTIDPARSAAEAARLVAELASEVALAQTELSQLRREAPESPLLPTIEGRIRALEAQIAHEQAQVTGSAGSLAPRIGAYEALVLEREFAAEAFTQARAALTTARLQARRQHLYLQRVVEADLPDAPALPNRLLGILVVFLSTLLAYGVGWLIFSSLREHRQG